MHGMLSSKGEVRKYLTFDLCKVSAFTTSKVDAASGGFGFKKLATLAFGIAAESVQLPTQHARRSAAPDQLRRIRALASRTHRPHCQAQHRHYARSRAA